MAVVPGRGLSGYSGPRGWYHGPATHTGLPAHKPRQFPAEHGVNSGRIALPVSSSLQVAAVPGHISFMPPLRYQSHSARA